MGRRVVSWQALVLVAAVMVNAAVGASLAVKWAPRASLVAEEGLAPSNLLLGSHR